MSDPGGGWTWGEQKHVDTCSYGDHKVNRYNVAGTMTRIKSPSAVPAMGDIWRCYQAEHPGEDSISCDCLARGKQSVGSVYGAMATR